METLTALIDGLADPDRESRLFRVERIVRFGAAAVEPLCAALRSGGLLTRCAAAMALGRIADRRAVPDLIQALRSSDTTQRELAVEALGKIGDPAAVPELIQTARGANAYLIIPSLEALGKIGDPRALDTLVRALRGFGQDGSVRAAAARALGELNHPAVLEPLCAAMPDAPQGALIEICRSLGVLGDVRAVPALCHAARRAWELEDGESVIAAASAALVRIGDVPEVAGLLEQGRTAPFALRTLAEFGKLAVPSLAAALNHPSEKVRLRALETLDEIAETEPEAARPRSGRWRTARRRCGRLPPG